MNSRTVEILADKSALIATVAQNLVQEIQKRAEAETVHIGLTGGSVGVGIMEKAVEFYTPELAADTRIHYWLSDERWLPVGDAERNDQQLDQAFFGPLNIASENIHRFLTSDSGKTLDEAAEIFTEKYNSFKSPAMDVLLLGVGPDAHIASLFPNSDNLGHTAKEILPIRNSPKPPPERLSFSLPMLNQAKNVWFCFSGREKAWVFEQLEAGTQSASAPVTMVFGTDETKVFVDASVRD